MIKNFGIAINSGSAGQRNAITNLFTRKGWTYWHWIDDFWIVQAPSDQTPKSIYTEISELPSIGRHVMIVFEMGERIAHYGMADPKAWAWLKPIGIIR